MTQQKTEKIHETMVAATVFATIAVIRCNDDHQSCKMLFNGAVLPTSFYDAQLHLPLTLYVYQRSA